MFSVVADAEARASFQGISDLLRARPGFEETLNQVLANANFHLKACSPNSVSPLSLSLVFLLRLLFFALVLFFSPPPILLFLIVFL